MNNILTDFMRAGMSAAMPIFGGEIVQWNGTDYEAVFHEEMRSDDLATGGFNPDKGVTLFIQTQLFTDGVPELGDIMVLRGSDWRVDTCAHGDVRVELRLVDPVMRRNE